MQFPAAALKARGFDHPLGDHWQGIQDINPGLMTREEDYLYARQSGM